MHHPGIRDQQIDRMAIVECQRPLGQSVTLPHIDYRDLDRGPALPAIGADLFEPVLVTSDQSQMHTGCGVDPCKGRTDPAAGTGDQYGVGIALVQIVAARIR